MIVTRVYSQDYTTWALYFMKSPYIFLTVLFRYSFRLSNGSFIYNHFAFFYNKLTNTTTLFFDVVARDAIVDHTLEFK